MGLPFYMVFGLICFTVFPGLRPDRRFLSYQDQVILDWRLPLR